MRRIDEWLSAQRDHLSSIDDGGSRAYSWTKNNIRFIQMHNYPTYEEESLGVRSSTAWLRKELFRARYSGERVVLNFHKNTFEEGLSQALSGFEDLVIAIFNGHIHNRAGANGTIQINDVPIPHFFSGSATWNYFLLAQFSETSLRVVVIDSENGRAIPLYAGKTGDSNGFGTTAIVASESVTSYPPRSCPTGLFVNPDSPNTCHFPAELRTRVGLVHGRAEALDRFGEVQATGDFNGDGFDDLAVATPMEDVAGMTDVGRVVVLWGSVFGLIETGQHIMEGKEPFERLGSALAVSDYNGDGLADLAIGAPGRTIAGEAQAGAIDIFYGAADGFALRYDELDQSSQLIPGVPTAYQRWGSSLAAGQFRSSPFSDLAVGVPRASVAGELNAGAVTVFYGRANGLANGIHRRAVEYWTQNSAASTSDTWDRSIADAAETEDRFGAALVTGDFNGDHIDDLAIGAPGEDVNGQIDAGLVNIVFGSTTGLTTLGNRALTQDSAGVPDAAEYDDELGATLAAADFNRDGRDELVVSVRNESVAGVPSAGAVHVFMGSDVGTTTVASQFWTQAHTEVYGEPGLRNRMGAALTTGDVNGDGYPELVVGVPGEDLGLIDTGMFMVAHGTPNGLVGAQDFWWQNRAGLQATADSHDTFGASLTSGDFNGDGYVDVVAAAPGEDLHNRHKVLVSDAGAISVIYGGPEGLSADDDQLWHQEGF